MNKPLLFSMSRGIAVLGLLLFSHRVPAATFTVTTTSDAGIGSFRAAIDASNTNNDADTIEFQILIPPFSISPTSPLPALISPVVVNATTQSGYVNSPVVELAGNLVPGSGVVGLRVAGGNSTVRGLAINRFSADAIRLDSSGNTIQGNYLGTDFTGLFANPNAQYGVFVLNTSSNLIGGTTAADRNVICGNDTGIYILNGGGNLVQGNYIGVGALGLAALGNRNNGVTIFNGAGNRIGGITPAERNVIGGNDGSGINLNGAGATGNIIQGNYVGVAATGATPVGNLADGITLNSAPGNLIGGTSPGARNLISGNGKAGVFLNGPGSTENRVEGNYIGTDEAGSGDTGNAFAGVTLFGAISNSIGGTVVEARNVISGNQQDGVFVSANSTGNRIRGNFIGVNASGTGALGNGFPGVTIDNSSFNLIAGNPAGVRSVISGNGNVGVWIHGANANSNAIKGNFIGTAVGGTNALGNARDGVKITDAADNQIGGILAEERNILSGNGFSAGVGAGISVENSSASGNVIRGNSIGTDITGQAALANRTEGIYMTGAMSNVIGGELAGDGNLISGNTTRGIRMANSSWNEIRGNFMGTRADGISGLGNGQFNVELEANCNGNNIGGLSPGAGNRIGFTGVFTGGPFAGVRVRDLSTNNAILGNAFFSNSGLGIAFSGANPTANDNNNCDADTGGNMRQNFPVLTQAYSGAYTTISGTLNSTANTLFRIQFFSSTACDASGNGEGQRYLGDAFLITDGACLNSFIAMLPVVVAPGNVITAIATDPANNTSEFSACSTVQAVPPSPLLAINLASNQVSFAWTNTATCFVLKATSSLSAPIQWATVMDAPVVTNGQFLVTLPRQAGNHFYRLYSPCAALPPSPLLEINSIASNQISLAWTITATGFVLKETDNLSPPIQWTPVTNTPAIVGGQFVVTLARQAKNRFYLLSFE